MVGPFRGNEAARRKQAEEAWHRLKAEVEAEQAAFLDSSRATLAEYMEEWLRRKEAEVRPTTFDSYQRLARLYVLPTLGKTALTDLSPAQVQRWLDALAKTKLSAWTRQYVRTVLRIALQDAVRLGQVAQNVVDRTRPPKGERKRVEAFTTEEVAALLDAAGAWRPFLALAAYSGLRRGELLGLKWEDVDLDAGVLTVRRNVAVAGGVPQVGEPKTKARSRTFTLPSPAVEALKEHKKAWAAARLRAGAGWSGEGWVFCTGEGKHLDPSDVERAWRSIRQRAGVRPLPLHALRHHAASVMLAAGVPLAVAAKRLGHSHVSVTVDT